MTPHRHLDPTRDDDLDLLADVLAGEVERPDCPTCQQLLTSLAAADLVVAAELAAVAALPLPAPPADLEARLAEALAHEQAGRTTHGSAPGAGAAGGVAADDPEGAAREAAVPAMASVTTLPALEERGDRASASKAPRWLPAAAAAVVLVGGGAFVAQSLMGGSDRSDDATASAAAADGLAGLVRNDTGTDYTATSLAAAVPGLLAGAPTAAFAQPQTETAPDVVGAPPAPGSGTSGGAASGDTGTTPGAAPGTQSLAPGTTSRATAGDLDRLRTTDGLAGCLSALLPPPGEGESEVLPLALDYGSFAGQPAMLVLLPVPALPRKVDVFVVGATCAPADEALLYFARVDRPAG